MTGAHRIALDSGGHFWTEVPNGQENLLRAGRGQPPLAHNEPVWHRLGGLEAASATLQELRDRGGLDVYAYAEYLEQLPVAAVA